MAGKNISTKSDFMSIDECQRLADNLKNDDKPIWELYIRLSISTALRVSDILSMRWEDVFSNRVMITEKKTKKKRKLFLSDDIISTAKEASFYSARNSGFIFINRKGDVLSRQYVNQTLKKFKAKYDLQVENFSTHSLRKSFCRDFWEQENRSEGALIILSQILNHRDVGTTRIYLGISDEEIDDVYKLIQARLYGKR